MSPAAGAASPWFAVWARTAEPDLRLVCFPFAGGGAALFRGWTEALPAGVEVRAVRYPGRETRLSEPPIPELGALVARAAVALEPFLDRPYAIFGHSLGALAGYEVARELRRRGHRGPAKLLVSACPAPDVARVARDPVHVLPDDALVARLRELGGTPEEVLQHAEIMSLLLPAIRADFAAVERYTHAPGPPLDCPLVALGGRADAGVSPADLDAWRARTSGPFESVLLPGDHFFIRSEPAPLLERIARELAPLLPPRADFGGSP